MSAPGDAKEHRTVSRVTNILELVARSENGCRFADLTAALDAPRSSVHVLVKGLVANGYLHEESGRYTIGSAVRALLAAPTVPIDSAARPSMEALHDKFNETVMLSFLVGDAVVYTDVIESTHMIRYSAPLRTRRPLYPTSSGKCFLAYANETFRENYLAVHIPEGEARDQVRAELSSIAKEGVAINRGQTLPDVSGVSVPIFGHEQLLAVLAMAGPTTRILDRLDEFAAAVKDETNQISTRLAG
ncbi:IclR family transcriptional regulator [Rhodococcus rhodochrous]|uniref:IclR family transcriptional regulator n=1 Tax=Rhodococcus rhodochrous TaxID=1829 RepID=UPI00030CF693|nr:IclR family transcriptional regulator [Rhodococcus rhodochrous]